MTDAQEAMRQLLASELAVLRGEPPLGRRSLLRWKAKSQLLLRIAPTAQSRVRKRLWRALLRRVLSLDYLKILAGFQEHPHERFTTFTEHTSGVSFRVDLSKPMQLQIYFAQFERDPGLSELAQRVASVGRFIDVGAHIGSLTLPIAALAPNARVLAVEPQEGNVYALREGARLNALNNVEVRQAAVTTEESETVVFYRNLMQDGGGGVGPGRDHSTSGMTVPREDARKRFAKLETAVEVPALTLEEVVGGSPCVVKLDCEGSDVDILRASESVLQGGNIKYLVAEAWRDHYEEIWQLLSSHYDHVCWRPPGENELVDAPSRPFAPNADLHAF